MVPQDCLLVILVWLIDLIPAPPETDQSKRGRRKTYPDQLFLKALVIMIVRQVQTPSGLLAILAQPTAEMRFLHQQLTLADGRFPCRRSWERRLAAHATHGGKGSMRNKSIELICVGRPFIKASNVLV